MAGDASLSPICPVPQRYADCCGHAVVGWQTGLSVLSLVVFYIIKYLFIGCFSLALTRRGLLLDNNAASVCLPPKQHSYNAMHNIKCVSNRIRRGCSSRQMDTMETMDPVYNNWWLHLGASTGHRTGPCPIQVCNHNECLKPWRSLWWHWPDVYRLRTMASALCVLTALSIIGLCW